MRKEKTELQKLLDSVHLYDSEAALILVNIESLKRMGFIDTSEHIRQLDEKIKRLQAEKLTVSRAIERIPDIVARMIFNARYNLGYTWDEVTTKAVKMSNRNAIIIHNKSMPEFEKILLEELAKDG